MAIRNAHRVKRLERRAPTYLAALRPTLAPVAWTASFLAYCPEASSILAHAAALAPLHAPAYVLDDEPRLTASAAAYVLYRHSGLIGVKDVTQWHPDPEQKVAGLMFAELLEMTLRFAGETGTPIPGGHIFAACM